MTYVHIMICQAAQSKLFTTLYTDAIHKAPVAGQIPQDQVARVPREASEHTVP